VTTIDEKKRASFIAFSRENKDKEKAKKETLFYLFYVEICVSIFPLFFFPEKSVSFFLFLEKKTLN